MDRFARLFETLEETRREPEKVAALTSCFQEASSSDAAWVLHFLCGRKISRSLNSGNLRTWTSELTGMPDWLIEDCFQSIGDLGETLNLLLPKATTPRKWPLKDLIEREILPLSQRSVDQKAQTVKRLWHEIDGVERLILMRLLTGNLRLSIPLRLLAGAMATIAELPQTIVLRRLNFFDDPSASSYAALLEPESARDAVARTYPFAEISVLKDEVDSLGAIDEWQIEWIWDGIRVQLIRREGELLLWSESGEILNGQFPEIEQAASILSDGTVLEGQIVIWDRDQAGAFYRLQRRLGRVPDGNRSLIDEPVAFVAADLLEWQGRDLREDPLKQRRHQLGELLTGLIPRFLKVRETNPLLEQGELFTDVLEQSGNEREVCRSVAIRFSEMLSVSTWEEVRDQHGSSREKGALGLELKRLRSGDASGRSVGDWIRWEVDPYMIRAVLVAAQLGEGKRRDLYVGYTFAVWKDKELVPVAKTHSGLGEMELVEVERFVRDHIQAKHGPVRSVLPELVFSIEFDGVEEAARSRAGIALRRPRISSLCRGVEVGEAGKIEELLSLVGA
jgi:DNA ligase 1